MYGAPPQPMPPAGQMMMMQGQAAAYAEPPPALRARTADEILEEKRELKERKEREERQAAKRRVQMKLDEQEQADKSSTIQIIVVLACVQCLGLLVTMLFGQWRCVEFVGVGVKFLQVRTNLFSINVDIQCGKNFIEDALCAVGKKFHGNHALHDATHLACSTSAMSCHVVQHQYWGAIVIFASFSIAIIATLCGTLFLCFYWYKSPVKKVRQWAMAFLALGPLSCISGFVFWAMYTSDLAQLPDGFNTYTSAVISPGILGDFSALRAVDNLPYGWGFYMACFSCGTSLVTICLFGLWFAKHDKEDETEIEEAMVRYAVENAAFAAAAAPGEPPGMAPSAPMLPNPGAGAAPAAYYGATTTTNMMIMQHQGGGPQQLYMQQPGGDAQQQQLYLGGDPQQQQQLYMQQPGGDPQQQQQQQQQQLYMQQQGMPPLGHGDEPPHM